MMIRRALGCTLGTCVMTLAGLTALGAGGYMTMTGNTLCTMMHGCGEKTNTADNKAVTTVAAKEGEKKSCCALAKTVAAKSGGCSGEATTVAASAKSSECAKACSGGKVASAKRGYMMMNGSVPVAMPAMFYAKGAFCTDSLKEVGGCNTPCSGEATVEKVVAKEAASGCCKGKTAAVSTVAAKEGAPAGCCKGTGTRADGTPCQKDGPHCDQGKTAEKAPEAEKSGEPVASRE